MYLSGRSLRKQPNIVLVHRLIELDFSFVKEYDRTEYFLLINNQTEFRVVHNQSEKGILRSKFCTI